jgi:hypothetical protein
MALWTQSDIDSLKAAVAGGVLEVRYDGPPMRLVRYQSLSEMRSLLASMAAEATRTAGGCSFSLGATSKGL